MRTLLATKGATALGGPTPAPSALPPHARSPGPRQRRTAPSTPALTLSPRSFSNCPIPALQEMPPGKQPGARQEHRSRGGGCPQDERERPPEPDACPGQTRSLRKAASGWPTAQPRDSEPTRQTRARTTASPDNLLVMELHCGCPEARGHTSNRRASPQAHHSKVTRETSPRQPEGQSATYRMGARGRTGKLGT